METQLRTPAAPPHDGAPEVPAKKRKNSYMYYLASEAALHAYLEKRDPNEHTRRRMTSRIGAGCGRIDWVERGNVLDEQTCCAAAKGGQLRVLQWLRGRDCPWDSETCRLAAERGHLALLKWAIGHGCPYEERDFRHTADPDFYGWFGEYKSKKM
mmetsp:Transcript_29280/g.58142  ORF Transcript_29280/g.58142 Transcript_29280/m.58142 type:complete len:155 (-) Transcript_29280:38-502(-)